jgi:hypothetical protein
METNNHNKKILALSATGTRSACSSSILSQTPFFPYKKKADKTNSLRKKEDSITGARTSFTQIKPPLVA